MEVKSIYSPRPIEDKPLERQILVHGAMHYKCPECGRVFRIWLEKGLEDPSCQKEQRKPVPFTIGCLCGGMMNHVSWGTDIHLPSYRPISDKMDYFENAGDHDYGVSHLRTDGTNAIIVSSSAQDRPFKISDLSDSGEVKMELPKPEIHMPNGLESYSTTQLKEEIRRRKRW